MGKIWLSLPYWDRWDAINLHLFNFRYYGDTETHMINIFDSKLCEVIINIWDKL